MEEMICEIDEF